MWYTSEELPMRIGIWYSATGLFTIFSGAINYAIGHANGSLSPWKYMSVPSFSLLVFYLKLLFFRYLFAGSLTILWSLVIFIVLPDSPTSSHRWFNEDERRCLVQRVKGHLARADSQRLKSDQAIEALKDIKVWLMAAMGAAVYVCNGGTPWHFEVLDDDSNPGLSGVTAFGSLIIKVGKPP
jgi:hypothetical protein